MDNILITHAVLVPTVILSCVMEVEAKYCLILDSGQAKHFVCGPFQHCCGASCCENFGPFYKLWYFWLCVMLALVFCSFGGYWYRRHYFQHRILAPQSMPSRNAMMMFMMNNIQTNNHYGCNGSEFYHSGQCQHSFPHHTAMYTSPPSHSGSSRITPQGVCCQVPAPPLSTPPPSYYETVYTPFPPDYTYLNSQSSRYDPPSPHAGGISRRADSTHDGTS